MAKLPLAPFEKILKESGKNVRVSESGARAFVEVIEEIAKEMGIEIAELARHANRKTILPNDVKLAYKRKK